MELKVFLAWVMSPIGAGILAYILIEQVGFLKALMPKSKRIAACAISAVLAIGAWFALTSLMAEPWPVTAWEWIAKLFFVGTSAFALATLIHGNKLPANADEVLEVAISTVKAAGYRVNV